MTDYLRLVAAAYVVLRRGNDLDEILLQLRQGTGFMDGYWAAGVAGHVEVGESVFDTARREAVEELGIDVATADLRPLTAVHRTGGTGNWADERVDFFFTCTRWSGEPRIVEPDKAADLRWFSLGALPDPVVPQERAVYETLRGGGPEAIRTYGFG